MPKSRNRKRSRSKRRIGPSQQLSVPEKQAAPSAVASSHALLSLVGKRAWKVLCGLIFVDGLFSLLKDVAAIAAGTQQFYERYLSAFDFGGFAHAVVLGSIGLYRAVFWPLLSWLQPATRDGVIILALVYAPQVYSFARLFIGHRIAPKLKPKPGWRFWMEWRALVTLSLVGQIAAVGFAYDPMAYSSVTYLTFWMVPLYIYYGVAYLRTDAQKTLRDYVVVALCAVPSWLALTVFHEAITVRAFAMTAFLICHAGMDVAITLLVAKAILPPQNSRLA